jgi:glutamine amidotransferase
MAKLPNEQPQVKAAILDYGLGNLFSVGNACAFAGMLPIITSSAREILAADLVILPGVGAFGDAMESLRKLDLIKPLQDIAASDKPLFGICLGMQLLMAESHEFGHHQGLGFIKGSVVRLDASVESSASVQNPHESGNGRQTKIPQVGWNRIFGPDDQMSQPKHGEPEGEIWSDTALKGLNSGEYMYFVHSFYAKLEIRNEVLSTSTYGNVEFCSSLKQKNIFACQFHPERSGPRGLSIYRNIADSLAQER